MTKSMCAHHCVLLILGMAVTGCYASSGKSASGKKQRGVASRGRVAAVRDWPQWGGSGTRNNTPKVRNICIEWDIASGKNIKWVAHLGSKTNGTPVVAGGKVFVGTNNAAGRLKRIPSRVDSGCMLCFNAADGLFLWQYSSMKLRSGNVEDWPKQGICSTPLVENSRVWFVSNRSEIVCLDTEGFADGKNDGPYTNEASENLDEADVVWKFDMKAELGVVPRYMSNCSLTVLGRSLFLCTSNGRQKGGVTAPDAPSFIAVDKDTGKVLWSDRSPGPNILNGQWSSPACGIIGGVRQVVFAGGDGWLYSFDPRPTDKGRARLLWKFDCNPKRSKWSLGSGGERNNLLATPVIYSNRIYIAVGQDPSHGEGNGRLWCVFPTKQGDVSPKVVFKADGVTRPIEHNPVAGAGKGAIVRVNPHSAVAWQYDRSDFDGDGAIGFEETMHRTICSVAIDQDLLVIGDLSGVVHCVDAKTGKQYWARDLYSPIWGSPLIAEGHVFIATENGDVVVFKLSRNRKTAVPVSTMKMGEPIRSTPIAAGEVLYIATASRLYAIQK